ncbi:MAG TPA: hypothetical protein H9755_14710 [Candidatus Dietzia intestinigallinarum]|nr:hypothetical protein [Candidatus Dietzia intestinigallinarum]
MDSQQNQQPEVEQQREDAPFGSSKGEMISMVLFGLMVIIASACFVIW